MTLADLEPGALPAALVLNQDALPHVNSLHLADLESLHGNCLHARGAFCDGELAGFLMAFSPRADYASLNLAWFRERYDDFVYVDRIIVGSRFRRRGLGAQLYRDLEQLTRARLACEVHIDPPNPESMKFHRDRGFFEVGRRERASMLLKQVATVTGP